MAILTLAGMVCCFLLLYIVFPYFCVGYMFRDKSLFNKFFYCLITGSFIVILIVYVLYFLRIFNVFTLIFSLMLFYIFCQLIGGRSRVLTVTQGFVKPFTLIKNGQFRWKTTFINLKSKAKIKLPQNPRYGYVLNVILFLLTLATIFYGLFIHMLQTVGVSYFTASDLYVHLDWLRDLENGYLFLKGVYPYGFHNLIIAFNTLFPFDMVDVVQLWGTINFSLILLSLIFLIVRMFKSPFARLTAIWVCCVSDIMVYFRFTDYRLSAGLPQGYSMIFIMPCIIFLFDYLKRERRWHLVMSALSLGLTLFIHFYSTILVILAIPAILIVYFRKIFNWKKLKNILVFFSVVVFITTMPLIIGLALGNPLEKSLSWAASLTSSNPVIDEKDNTKEFLNQENEGSFRNLIEVIKNEVTYNFLADQGHKEEGTDYSFLGQQNTFKIPIFISIIAAIAVLIIGFKKKTENASFQLFYLIYFGTLFSLAIGIVLGFPQIIALYRLWTIMRFWIIPVFGFLPELLDLLADFGRRFILVLTTFLSLLIVMLLGYDSILMGHRNKGYVSTQAQYEQTVRLIQKIKKNFPSNSYTLVATTHEVSLVRNSGFHYELIEFLQDMQNPQNKKSLYIPSENIFIYIEKNVLPVYRIVDFAKPAREEKTEKISIEAALTPLPEANEMYANQLSTFYYDNIENRTILMSKIYYWAMEYKKFFPDEMKIYYEDDDILVYHIKQDTYALNNLYLATQ